MACVAKECIHVNRHDAARISANHTKSNLTARTDIKIITWNNGDFNLFIAKSTAS